MSDKSTVFMCSDAVKNLGNTVVKQGPNQHLDHVLKSLAIQRNSVKRLLGTGSGLHCN